MVFWVLLLISYASLGQGDGMHRQKRYSGSSKQLTFWVDALKYKKWSPMMPGHTRPHRDFFS